MQPAAPPPRRPLPLAAVALGLLGIGAIGAAGVLFPPSVGELLSAAHAAALSAPPCPLSPPAASLPARLARTGSSPALSASREDGLSRQCCSAVLIRVARIPRRAAASPRRAAGVSLRAAGVSAACPLRATCVSRFPVAGSDDVRCILAPSALVLCAAVLCESVCDEPPESAACSTIATLCPRRRPALHCSNVIGKLVQFEKRRIF